jgi:polar amino acid transport system substrate-binding protein
VIRKKGNAFRLGGDEFVIFLTNIKNRLEVVRICQALLKRLTQNYSIDEYELHIDFSIGISLYPEDGLDLEMLMKTADTAMSVARNHGINHFMFYNPKMSLDVYEQLILSNRLKNAVEREEFELLYQPKLDLKKRKIVGFEALLRWNHPEKGLLSPIDFIQLAEQNRTIFKIGEWALNQTCILIKKLEAEGYNVSIAVNLSPIQFLKENIYKEIYKIIESTQIQPQLLEIEITESSIMKNIDYTVKALNLLKKIGVTISLDDFGTGYSSLSYLKIFPIHKVKIDKSFIQEIPESKKDTAILKAIVELAKSLELKTIVEGVETKVQLDYLNEINCDEVQGYLISKPLRKENIPKVLQKENWLI